MVNKKFWKGWSTIWWILKRFLRTVVPQIPSLMSYFGTVFPAQWLPVLVAIGGVLTVVDKLFRDLKLY